MRRAALLMGLLAMAPALDAHAALAQSSSPQAAAPDDAVVARRGDTVLTASAVRELIRYADPETRHALQTDPAALGRLVRDRLLQMAVLDAAHAAQWDQKPDVIFHADQARAASIVDSYVASISQPDPGYPSDADIQAAYDANKARLMVPRQYHIAQIYLAVPAADPAADAEAQKRLGDLRAQIARGRTDFAAAARRQSDDKQSAPNGGDLGWVREDQMIPAVKSVVSGMAEATVSDPIHAADGWHLIRLLGTRPAAPAPLPDVRDALVRALRQERARQNARGYLNTLLKQQPVQLNEIGLAALVPK